ncbi:hypothetical protein, partial [Bacillus thuringiensis]
TIFFRTIQEEVIIMTDKKERVEMRIPQSILKKVDEYKEENGISTRTATILELIRKGLNK